jgi:hypothetical protein
LTQQVAGKDMTHCVAGFFEIVGILVRLISSGTQKNPRASASNFVSLLYFTSSNNFLMPTQSYKCVLAVLYVHMLAMGWYQWQQHRVL